MTEDESVGWHHRCNGHEFEQIPGDSKEQRSLTCCLLWCLKVRHGLTIEQLMQKPQGTTRRRFNWARLSGEGLLGKWHNSAAGWSSILQEGLESQPPAICQGERINPHLRSWLDKGVNTRGHSRKCFLFSPCLLPNLLSSCSGTHLPVPSQRMENTRVTQKAVQKTVLHSHLKLAFRN